MSILIEKAGLLTTVQDLGRFGYRRFGINPSGVMDSTATRLINVLAGNDENAAVLEMHFPAARILFEDDTVFAIGGADLQPRLNGKEIDNWRLIFAKRSDVLTFTGKATGERSYLAVSGGLEVDDWLGSSSTNAAARIGGFHGRKLEAGDRITCPSSGSGKLISTKRISSSLIPRYSQFPTVRIVAGSEFGMLQTKGRELLVNQDFVISNSSNRMGYRLTGEPISLEKPVEMLSSAVGFGTIQLLPDGQLVVLMADHQTTGGYPRIAHIVSYDLPLIAQLGSGDKIAFHLVSLAAAEQLSFQFERDLSFFRIGCRFQANSWAI